MDFAALCQRHEQYRYHRLYQADNDSMAKDALEQFSIKWKYKHPAEIRMLIHTTDVIESFNASLRKYTQDKQVF